MRVFPDWHSGVLGWVVASTYPGPLVPVCSVLAIVSGVLGVRSKLRTPGLIGFIMGMFLLPNAISTVLHLLRG